MLHEYTALTQLLMLFIDINRKLTKIEGFFTTLLTQSEIERVNTKECNESHCSIDVVTKSFNQFCSLGLNDIRFLAITGVKCETNELLWIIKHLLSLRFSCLDHLEAYVENQVGEILQENCFELLILRDTVNQLN